MGPILIVDDERPIRQLLGRWLADAGYRCTEADSADAALTAMASEPAAVIFCDVQMPGHDGLWLTREVRTQYPTSAVVLATGITTVPPNISMQSGVLAYLVKPFSRQSVLNTVAQALKWHEQAAVTPARPEDADALDKWLNTLERHDL